MAGGSAIRSFTLDLDALSWTGRDLQRPESVVAEPDGTLWASDGRGGVTRIDPDGGQALLGGWGGEPNGLAIDPDGNLVTANIGLGRVQRMTRDGLRAMQEVYPGGPPRIRPRRLIGAGDLWIGESVVEYSDGKTYHGVAILEFRDGKMWRDTRYFGEPFDASAWRAQWVQRIEEPVDGRPA